ncbi:MAG: hypothetical protein IKJ74_07735 [Clostridia bacterium]|nr:hypothetical protein [Clostridia bacterium]
MKRVVSILLAVLMLASLLTVTSGARGYTLSVPESVSAHNLEAYGLHTMNVYSTEVPPTIDGKIGQGEYPGPENGCSLYATPGDNLWMNAYYPNSSGDQNSYYPECNWSDYVDSREFPDYVGNFLTYDDNYLYFAVATVIPAIRPTTDNKTAYTRSALWFFETRSNFMQSDNIAISHGGNSSSFANTRYSLYKYNEQDNNGNILPGVAQSVSLAKRIYTLYENDKFTTTTLGAYVDELGQTWNSTIYKRAENFTYQVTVQEDGKWKVVFEGRQPLGDVLRITDVEYEDGTPIDYVPEWGAWACSIRLQAYYPKVSTLPNGSEAVIHPEDVLYAQTFYPAGGAATSGMNGTVAGYLLHNTVGAAIQATHGKKTVTPTFLMNPVHFLGAYDSNFVYDDFYSAPTETVLKTTSRVTRTRGVLTSGVRGVNNRVVGVATKAAVATGDDLTLTVICSAVMILCAATAVTVVVMKKRSGRSR